MKNFFRRLVCFVNDPRYGLFYSPGPEAYRKAWGAEVGDSMNRPFSLVDSEPENQPSFATALQEVHPPLEWPDFLGNGLFGVFCIWVLMRGLMSPEGAWLFLQLLMVIVVSLAQLMFGLGRLVWRRWFSHDKRC